MWNKNTYKILSNIYFILLSQNNVNKYYMKNKILLNIYKIIYYKIFKKFDNITIVNYLLYIYM